MTVLVVGEALVDLVPGGDGRLAAHPGGGPYNAARTLARLGAPTVLLTRLSSDSFGDRLRAELEADGVSPAALVATDDPTTLALAETDDAGVARYVFYSADTAAAGLTREEALAALPDDVSALLAGTLGLVLEPLAGAVEAVTAAVAEGTLVLVDPNCRADAIADEAAYRERLARVLANTDVVKVSEEDLDWLSPGTDPQAAARELLAAGPSVALLSLGPDGARVLTAEGDLTVPSPAVEVVDTIGAGDALGGGFLAWWQRHGLGREALADAEALRAATDYAVRVAARTCERAGAAPPTLDELPD